MKKLILTSFAVFASFAFMNAQNIADNAIGLRLGFNDNIGTEISYQRALGDNNRLEIDLGWRGRKGYDAFKLTGIYQWVWELDENFNWYTGAGGGLGSVSFDNNSLDSETFFFLSGDLGVEYDFDFPLILSFGIRPEIGFADFNDGIDIDVALGIRYQF
ncbi:hypothetical protein [Winogradskyella sp. R77965]|uniref:hypothetical protein n=1 Tax=Winogradskyella sp. R77965 TaxID=3093872 RepID=UPI0037DCE69C